jgi:hypothetical protein
MFLILGLLLVIFGQGWRILGIPGRPLGVALILAGLLETAYWTRRTRRDQARFVKAVENAARKTEPERSRHVALRSDGKGATFYLSMTKEGQPRWTWRYDEGVYREGVWDPTLTVLVEQAIFRMNQRLGLPQDPQSNPWASEPPGYDLPGWPWKIEQQSASTSSPPSKWSEADVAQRFNGSIELQCGHSFAVVALRSPEVGQVRRCPKCRLQTAVTDVSS